jgi:alpha-amylase
MRDNFTFGGDLTRVDGAGFAMKEPYKSLTFVENHDVAAPQNRLLAYAFLSAYPGYPMYNETSLTDPALRNLVWIHNNKAYGTYHSRHASRDVLVFEREHNLLAGINQSDSWQTIWVYTSWTNTSLHDLTGSIGDAWVNGDGWVEVAIPPMGYVMLAP